MTDPTGTVPPRTFTPRQRAVLIRRVARAVCWARSEGFERTQATTIAEHVVDDIEEADFSAMAQRRAITALAEKMERTA